MCLLGMYNLTTAAIEGADDPGGVITKKASMLAMLSALNLFQKGCDGESDADNQPSLAMVIFTATFGFMFLLAWWLRSGSQQHNVNQFEPDAEPEAQAAQDPAMHDDDVEMSVAAEAEPSPRREPNAEDYMSWLIERCERRRTNAEDADRRQLYNERFNILYGLRGAMRSEHESWRTAALQSLATMPDISDDENSPSFASINAPVVNFGDAQRAMSFINALQQGQSSSSGFSTNVDMVANALIRNLDPDLWLLLHYGETGESESAEDDAET